jgi:putative addiction module component (TIGR02574 family)
MKLHDIPEIAALSKPEKILLVEDLWDAIAENETDIPIPESHKLELDSRYKRYSRAPGHLLTIEELRLRISRHK